MPNPLHLYNEPPFLCCQKRKNIFLGTDESLFSCPSFQQYSSCKVLNFWRLNFYNNKRLRHGWQNFRKEMGIIFLQHAFYQRTKIMFSSWMQFSNTRDWSGIFVHIIFTFTTNLEKHVIHYRYSNTVL